MPFTPFHFGPALGFGLPLRKYIHLPTFMLANVVVDIEPFLVLFLGSRLRYPLHGYLHTFLLASFLGLVLGGVMFLLEETFQPLFRTLSLEKDMQLGLTSFVAAGVLGTMLHVLLDSPLYSDIRPFYPLAVNPFYNPDLTLEAYSFCVLMGILGLIFYAGLLAFSAYGRLQKKRKPDI